MSIDKFRNKIDIIDSSIITLISKRQKYVLEIAKIKSKENITIIDHAREEQLKRMHTRLAKKLNISLALINKIFKLLISNSYDIQKYIS